MVRHVAMLVPHDKAMQNMSLFDSIQSIFFFFKWNTIVPLLIGTKFIIYTNVILIFKLKLTFLLNIFEIIFKPTLPLDTI